MTKHDTNDNQAWYTYSDNTSSIRPRLEFTLLLVCGFCLEQREDQEQSWRESNTDDNEDQEERVVLHDMSFLIISPARV